MADTIIKPFMGYCKPHLGRSSGYAQMMKRAQVPAMLAANLDALLDADEAKRGVRLTHVTLGAKAKVGAGTVGRVARAEVAAGIDTVDALASVFSLQAWQMLVPALTPAEPPELVTPALRQELDELRAMRAQLEEMARGGRGSFQPGSPRGGGSGDRPDIGEQQKGGGKRERAADD